MHDLSPAGHAHEPAPDADPGTVAWQVVVSGRVQGVFFRASTQERAEALGLVGWVRNTPEGTVEAWVEGRADAVERILAWMRAGGPPSAVVDALEVDQRDPAGHDGFEVR